MDDFELKISTFRVNNPFNTSPHTLQSLCCKTILMQVNFTHLHQYHEYKPSNPIISNNVDKDLTENLCYTELVNCKVYPEKLSLDIHAKEWMDLKKLDYIHQNLDNKDDLTSNSTDNFSQILVNNSVVIGSPVAQTEHVKSKSLNKDCRDNICKIDKSQKEHGVDDLIILSSDEDSDLELPDDIDSISLSSIEAYEQYIQNGKVTIEISPQLQYTTNFDATTTPKVKKQLTRKTPNINTTPASKFSKQVTTEISLKCSKTSKASHKETIEKCTIISITSDDDDSCSGYNSSDFEFITEEEAKADGLIIHFNNTNTAFNKETCRTIEVYKEKSAQRRLIPTLAANNENNEDYRQNHQIPNGDEYFDLFRGIYAPTAPWYYENKSMGVMVNDYSGIGFDIRVLSRQIKEHQQESEEYKEEAAECAKKILNMYPGENRKRRRRFY